MRFRLGAIVGFGAGYYLGARAGRERYEQLNRWIRRAQSSDAFETASDKAKAVFDLGVERAKDVVADLRDAGDSDGGDRTDTFGTRTTTTSSPTGFNGGAV